MDPESTRTNFRHRERSHKDNDNDDDDDYNKKTLTRIGAFRSSYCYADLSTRLFDTIFINAVAVGPIALHRVVRTILFAPRNVSVWIVTLQQF